MGGTRAPLPALSSAGVSVERCSTSDAFCIGKMHIGRGFVKAQTSLEFMMMVTPILLVFAVTIYMYAAYAQEASQNKKLLEASSICLMASSAISSLAALPGNSTYSLSLPKYLDGANYTVFVAANSRLVKVNYGSSGIGCRLPSLNITDSAGSALFMLQKNATIRSSAGVLVVET